MFKLTTINLDKDRHLKLTIKGITEFNQVTGIDILQTNLEDLSPKEMMALIWTCLMWEDKELRIDDIPELIEPIDATELAKLLMEGILNSMPEVKPETAPLVVPDSTTVPSGVSQSTTSDSHKFLS